MKKSILAIVLTAMIMVVSSNSFAGIFEETFAFDAAACIESAVGSVEEKLASCGIEARGNSEGDEEPSLYIRFESDQQELNIINNPRVWWANSGEDIFQEEAHIRVDEEGGGILICVGHIEKEHTWIEEENVWVVETVAYVDGNLDYKVVYGRRIRPLRPVSE